MSLRASLTGVFAALAMAPAAFADSWTLDGENSKLAFGSVKKEFIGEVHSFTGLSGSVSDDGSVAVEIDLTSVETNIDIRNERMMEHVFKGLLTAKLDAQIDMEAMNEMSPGSMSVIDVDGVLSFLGQEVEVYTEMFVARISDEQVMVTTNDMIFLNTEELGIEAGIDKLMALAELPGITRSAPVTLRLIFNLTDQKA